jgi:hypothetical protein
MSDDILREFALDTMAISVMITMQQLMIHNDISRTGSGEEDEIKKCWLDKWTTVVKQGFQELGNEIPGQTVPSFLAPFNFNPAVNEIKRNPIQAGLILLELVTFQPYYPFDKNSVKELKKISVDEKNRKLFLKDKSSQLGFHPEKADELDGLIKSTANSMTGKWVKIGFMTLVGVALGAVTFGIAAPFIAGIIGASMGLSGAVAINAGLAAIGGGAIAAGGLGMAGGTTILVGGGALLGLGLGATGGQIYASISSESVLLQSVKLEVALKEFVLQGQYDTAKAQEILFKQRQVIEKLEREIDGLRVSGNEDDKRIKDLDEAVKILRNALQRNQNLVRGAA